MKLGLQLPIQAQSSIFVEPWEKHASPDDLVEIAQHVESLGFDYVGVCDHVVIPHSKVEAMGSTWFDTVATLGWLASATRRLRLLSHVYVVAYRPAVMTAKAFLTLDWLSGSRVILGIGAGHVEGEFAELGVDFSTRGELAESRLKEIRSMFSTDPAGRFEQLHLGPRSQFSERIPIYVGGSSSAAMRRAATLGDGWLPQGTPVSQMPAAIENIARLRAEAGREMLDFFIGAIAPPIFVGNPSWDLERPALVGSVEKIAEYLNRYSEAGVTTLQVRPRSSSKEELLDQLSTISELV